MRPRHSHETKILNATPRTKKAIQAFPAGKAIAILPDGTQQVVRFYERVSPHPSHTPRVQAALAKFAATDVDLDALPMRDFTALVTDPNQTKSRKRRHNYSEMKEEQPRIQVGKVKHAPRIRERIYTLLDKDPTLTNKQHEGPPRNSDQETTGGPTVQNPWEVFYHAFYHSLSFALRP